MDSAQLADIVVTFLESRDDIAKAEVVEDPGDRATGLVTTQGGQRFWFAVEPTEG